VSASPPTVRSLERLIRAIVATSPRRAAAAVVLTFAVGLAEGMGLLVLIPLLQLVGIDAHQGSLGRIVAVFQAAFSAVGLVPSLPAVLGLYVGIVAAQSLLQRQQTVVQTRMREDLVHGLRIRLYRAIAGTTWVYFSRNRASFFGQALTERVDRVATAAYYLLDLFVTGVLALVYVAVAFRVSPAMTALVVLCGGLLALALRGRRSGARAAGEVYASASTRLYAATFDHLDSMKIAKGYGAERRHAERFAHLSSELGDASLKAATSAVIARQWLTVGSALLLAVIVYVARAAMELAPATLFLLIFLFARLVPRVTSIYERSQMLAVELPALESVMDTEARCREAAEAEPRVHEPVRFDRSIDCRGVTFSYRSDARAPALEDVTLSIAARSTTAVVGASGAGKSTLADVLMGLVTPSAGCVAVDDVPLMPERLQSWRSQVGYVSQDTFLFHDTVRANLLWANPTSTDEEIWLALTQAAAADFVRGFPQGLDTIIGDRGLTLSGGERQRLSLARALLRNPKVLILDEATSSLDSENERRIQDAIDDLHEQVTIVVITHRLSTIRNADLIYVMERGRVVESGTWNGLVSRLDSRLRGLCEAQGVDVATAALVSAARPSGS
jgi:ATP-binding cassette, subfamily C, bacterial